MAKARDPLTRVRDIIEQWPETSEKLSHGAPTWWGGRKTFATLHEDHHGDGRLALWIKSTHEAQEDLVAMDSKTFFVPAYVGPSGWVGMRLDRRPNWGMVESLLLEGYRSVAPKRALKQLDLD
jgi:hypothetical protein